MEGLLARYGLSTPLAPGLAPLIAQWGRQAVDIERQERELDLCADPVEAREIRKMLHGARGMAIAYENQIAAFVAARAEQPGSRVPTPEELMR